MRENDAGLVTPSRIDISGLDGRDWNVSIPTHPPTPPPKKIFLARLIHQQIPLNTLQIPCLNNNKLYLSFMIYKPVTYTNR